MCYLSDPGKSHPPGSSYCGPVKCVTLFGRGILFCYWFLLEEMKCVPEDILFKMYVMKIWEGMVQNS